MPNYMCLNNRFQYTVETYIPAIDAGRLARCRVAMAAAVGVGRGLILERGIRFTVRRLHMCPCPSQGGVWTIDAPDRPDIARIGICRDANVERATWTAVHGDWQLIVSRPCSAPPPLPWSVDATSDALACWGEFYGPWAHAQIYLGLAWWDLYEAGALGE